MYQLFLDCDGVLADFDKKAKEIFGMPSSEFEEKYGAGKFWKTIHQSGEFFYELDEMEDARELYDAVKHLDPIILTGVPSNEEAIGQKVRWVRRIFGRKQPVTCCLSRQKYLYCTEGDILVDDTLKHSQKWIDAGGIFVHHTSAKESIQKLKELKVL
jgi:hypothetical protein